MVVVEIEAAERLGVDPKWLFCLTLMETEDGSNKQPTIAPLYVTHISSIHGRMCHGNNEAFALYTLADEYTLYSLAYNGLLLRDFPWSRNMVSKDRIFSFVRRYCPVMKSPLLRSTEMAYMISKCMLFSRASSTELRSIHSAHIESFHTQTSFTELLPALPTYQFTPLTVSALHRLRTRP
jgi:hypothetical protein